MKIALFGYGKMGKEIETLATKNNHEIVLIVDSTNSDLLTSSDLKKADVAIEFSRPDAVISNITTCFNANLPIVVGTTGWQDNFKSVEKLCKQKKGGLLYASNFSLGVNLFFKVNTYLAELMNKYEDYEVSLEEIHHLNKLDKPSGTAITLANKIIDKIDRKKNWSILNKNKDTVFIKDIREGSVSGTHIIKYNSTIDDIEIMHKAHNRKGFAQGAIIAAEFLKDKKGIYTMNDII